MKNTLRDLGPTAAALGAILWLCWPHLAGGNSLLSQMGSEKLIGIDKSRLKPTAPAASDRDPFRTVAQMEEAIQDELPPPVDQPQTPIEPPVPAPDPQRVLKSLNLRGTFVNGKRNCALIGDQLRFEGDEILNPTDPDIRCTLKRVLRDSVWLDANGQALHLVYTESTAGPGPLAAPEQRDRAAREDAENLLRQSGDLRFTVSQFFRQLHNQWDTRVKKMTAGTVALPGLPRDSHRKSNDPLHAPN